MTELNIFKCWCDGANREGTAENEDETEYNHKITEKAKGNEWSRAHMKNASSIKAEWVWWAQV